MNYRQSIRALFEAVLLEANTLSEGMKRDARVAASLDKRTQHIETNPGNIYNPQQRAAAFADVAAQRGKLKQNALDRAARIGNRERNPHTKEYRRMVHGLQQGPAPEKPKDYPYGDMTERTPQGERRRANWTAATHGMEANVAKRNAEVAQPPKPTLRQRIGKLFGR